MKIGLVGPGFAPGGGEIETVVTQLAAGLRGHGHQVHVLAQAPLRWPPRRPATRRSDGLIVERSIDWCPRGPVALTPHLWRRLYSLQDGWDLVHAHGLHHSPALAVALLADAPFVLTPYYAGRPEPTRPGRRPSRHDPLGTRVIDGALRIVCFSQAEADQLSRDHPRAGEKIRVVPLGVDVAALRSARPILLDRPVIFAAAPLRPLQQLDVALAALVQVPEAVLLLAGTGPAARSLRQVAERLEVADRVRFLGPLDARSRWSWLRGATVALGLARQAALGLSLLEAALAGCQVVATDLPAHREVADRVADPTAFEWLPPAVGPDDLAAVLRQALARPRRDPTDDLSRWAWDQAVTGTMADYQGLLDGLPAVRGSVRATSR